MEYHIYKSGRMVNLHLHVPMTQLMVTPCAAHPTPRLFSASRFVHPMLVILKPKEAGKQKSTAV